MMFEVEGTNKAEIVIETARNRYSRIPYGNLLGGSLGIFMVRMPVLKGSYGSDFRLAIIWVLIVDRLIYG